MAVTRAMNVYRMAADGDTIVGSFGFEAIRAVETAGATARVRLRDTNASGVILWDSALLAANGAASDEICLNGTGTLYLEVVSGAAALYLYS